MITCYEFFGKINYQFKTTMGEEYTKILSEMSDDIKLQKELDRIFKPSDIDGVTNRGELAMKRISNGTTTSGEVRDLAIKIQERTGIDLIKEARLAQMSMDIVWDTRWANLFGIIKDGKNGIVKSALDMGRNLVANKEAVARANTLVTKNEKIIWIKQYSPHNISVLADNSFKNTGKEFAKNNRLSGKKYSFLEAETGKTFKWANSKNRIQISLQNEKLHIDDGRYLLQAYLELNKSIPWSVVQFTNSAKKFYIQSILESRKNKKSSSSKINTLQK